MASVPRARLSLAVVHLVAALGLGGCDDAAPAPVMVVVDAAVVDALPGDGPAIEVDQAIVGPRLIHVGASADPRPPDGSRERPYPTAREGFLVAEAGDVVFLLEGEHRAIEALPPDVELLGAGPESTRLAGPLQLAQAGAVVGGFTLVGGALDIQQPASVSDVRIDGAPTPALIGAAPATLNEVSVDTPIGTDPAVRFTATVTWEGGGVSASPGIGIWAEGADLTLIDLDLTDIAGFGIFAEGGQHQVRGLRVRGAAGAAARFLRAETTVVDCGIADVATFENVGAGVGFVGGTGSVDGCEVVDAERGLRVTLGGRMTARNIRVTRMRGDGVSINDEAEGEVEDLVVDGARAGGVTVVRARATLRRVSLSDGRRHGLLVSRSTATVEGIEVSGGEARGIALLNSTARVEGGVIRGSPDVCVQVTDPEGENLLSGLTLEGCAGAGLGVFGVGTGSVALRDSTITGTTLGVDDFAAGVHVFDGAVQLSSVTIRGGSGEGVRLEGAAGRLDAVTVEDTPGPGLVALDPSAPIVVEGLVARRNGGAGVLVTGGALDLGAPTISGSTAAPGIGPGDGIAAPFQAVLTVRGGDIGDNANHGISVEGLSTVRLRESVRLHDNGGFGVQVGCGSTVEIPASYESVGNARGAESFCN